MNKFALTYLCFLIAATALGQCEGEVISAISGLKVQCPQYDYVLVFYDEFEGNNLDNYKWQKSASNTAPTDKILWQNCRTSQEIFLEDNVVISDGVLNLIPKKENYTYSGISEIEIACENEIGTLYEVGDFFEEEFSFTSGMVLSKIAHSPREHLYIESRIKIPKGVGLAPAFWTWHHDEIDIFEFSNSENSKRFSTNYHHSDGGSCRALFNNDENLSEDFHTYAVEITPWFIKWYLDSEVIRIVPKFYTILGQVATFECGQELPGSNYVENRIFPDMEERWFAPIINLGISTAFNEDEITGLLEPMQTDFVRVYRRLAPDHEKNLCMYNILGESAICQEEELVYTLDSNEALEEINWRTSSNLTILDIDTNQISIAIAPGVPGAAEGFIEAEIIGRDAFCPENIRTKTIRLNPGMPEVFQINESQMTCLGESVLGKYSTNPIADVIWEVDSGPVDIHIQEGDYTLVEAYATGTFTLKATAIGRCGEDRIVTATFVVETCEMELIKQLSPNPADEVLNIEFGNTFSGQEFEVIIFNSAGQIQFQTSTFDDLITIDVSGFANGIYFIQVRAESEQAFARFVVSH